MKTLSLEAKRARVNHDAFITMLYAAVTWPEKWDASELLGSFWTLAFPESDIQETDFNNLLINRIREKLLVSAGVIKPLLCNYDNRFVRRIQKEIVF